MSKLRVIRLVFASLCIAVLVLALTSFDALGADCGDAPTAGGSDAFTCNAPAYVLMAAAAVAALGLLGVLAWMIADALRARRRTF